MSGYGLKSTVIFPVYGLAEASLAVAFSDILAEPTAFHAGRQCLVIAQQVSFATGDTDAIALVEVSTGIENCTFMIADDQDSPLQDGIVGNILIRGGNVTAGYYNNEKATRNTITPDGWLRTGDLGFTIN